MKIFYRTDSTIDENLLTKCPFGEEHHFKRDDGSEFTMIKYVGCRGCVKCKHCYGTSTDKPDYALFSDNNGKLTLIPELYIKCMKCYTKPTIWMKIQRFFYHACGRIIWYFQK